MEIPVNKIFSCFRNFSYIGTVFLGLFDFNYQMIFFHNPVTDDNGRAVAKLPPNIRKAR